MPDQSAAASRRARDILESSGALLSGHFALSSGLHSDRYCQCARALEDPANAAALAALMVDTYADRLSCDCVVAPALGGVVWGFALATALGCRSLFAERGRDGAFSLRRGFGVVPGERVVIAEDVVTTGGSVDEVRALMTELGADVGCVASIVDRSGGTYRPEGGFVALTELQFQTFEPASCPMCSAGSKADKQPSMHAHA